MGEVAVSVGSLQWFEYGEPAWWAERGMTEKAGSPWLTAIGSGWARFNPALPAQMKDVTGIDRSAVTRAISIGQGETEAVRFDGGFQEQVVRDKMTGLGARPHRYGEHDGLTFGLDGYHDLAKPPVPLPGAGGKFSQVVVTESAVAFSLLPGPVLEMFGGNRSLAADPRFAGVAECLGDVVSAVTTTPGPGGAVALYGVGLRRPADLTGRPVNVVCVLGTPAVKQRFTKSVTAKELRAEEVTHDEVRAGGHTFLRATARLTAGAPAFITSDMLVRGRLQPLVDPAEAAFDTFVDDALGG